MSSVQEALHFFDDGLRFVMRIMTTLWSGELGAIIARYLRFEEFTDLIEQKRRFSAIRDCRNEMPPSLVNG